MRVYITYDKYHDHFYYDSEPSEYEVCYECEVGTALWKEYQLALATKHSIEAQMRCAVSDVDKASLMRVTHPKATDQQIAEAMTQINKDNSLIEHQYEFDFGDEQ